MEQRVLITAGASGIGREIARAFAGNGAKVFVYDIDATLAPLVVRSGAWYLDSVVAAHANIAPELHRDRPKLSSLGRRA
jgi:NAD(P)-dependent dehydrogenase (short-subunit alcohol dehydrogenase family)